MSRRAGFTLIELLLVCLVIATLAALVAPNFAGSQSRARLDATARAVVALARGARARASAEGRAYFLVVDGEQRILKVARQRDPLAAPDQEGDSELEGDGWTDGAPWARTISFEDDVQLGPFTVGSAVTTPLVPAAGSTSAAPSTVGRVGFSPDGTADEAVFHFDGPNGSKVHVVIEPATGRAKVVDVDEEGETH